MGILLVLKKQYVIQAIMLVDYYKFILAPRECVPWKGSVAL